MLTLATYFHWLCWLLHVSDSFRLADSLLSCVFYFHPRHYGLYECWRVSLGAFPLLQQPLQSFSKVGSTLHLGAALMLNVLLYFLLTSFVDEQNLLNEILNNYHYYPNPIWPQTLSEPKEQKSDFCFC